MYVVISQKKYILTICLYSFLSPEIYSQSHAYKIHMLIVHVQTTGRILYFIFQE